MEFGFGLGLAGVALMSGAAPAPFHPSQLFADGQAGHWPGGYDPTSGRIWQAATGTVARVTAAGQPVGIVPDRSKGGVLGAELSAPSYTINAASGFQAIHTAVAAGLYRFDITVVSGDGRCRQQGTSPAILGGFTYAPAFVEADIPANVGSQLRINLSNAVNLVCHPTLRLIAGNHAWQEVALSRPTLQQTGGKWHLVNDGGDSLPVKLPTGTYGRAWVSAAGVVTVDTVVDPVNALIPGEANATQADVILRAGAFTVAEEAHIRAWWGGLYT